MGWRAVHPPHIAAGLLLLLLGNLPVTCHQDHQDAVHITAILGESVVFNCQVDFPEDVPVPYVLQWEKKVGETGQDIPIYIWYESYPTHSGEGYEGRVSRVAQDSPYGAASLNLTNIRESDQGWYECKVVFLNRSPNQHKNGTWFHLDVHAPPRFSITPEDIIYVNLGDAIILNCQAEGTPTPEILWYKDANPVEPSGTVGIFNDGTELRISNIRHEDIGDYTCIARNGEGQVSHTARVIIAGGAVITMPPTNQTKLEGEKVQFSCEAKALPGNVTVKWFREGAPVAEVAALETRVTIQRDGALVINPVAADDSGQYLCEVSNGIGDPQSASAYLNVEYPAKVTFTPTVQYLPFRLAGVVQCYIKANPPLQYVTWTKDKRLLEPYQTKDIVIMNNGSLLFTRVNQNHQGRYTCTPYNAQGTQGSSGPMEVLVRKPPAFTVEPEPLYQRKVGESVEMHCEAQEAEGTQRPSVTWRRRDGLPLQKNRVRALGGNITIDTLRRQDFGIYQCVASNEVATIVADTQLVIEGTQPHAPYNLSGTATEFQVTLRWQPGYAGGPDYKQDYTIWYREAGFSDWTKVPVTPSGATSVTINRLQPGTTYEFQVNSKNTIGEGMMSKTITIRTLGPKSGPPRNLTVTEVHNGFLITWQAPLERAQLVQYYTIKYRTDAQWKTLNRGQIRPEETSYLVKNLVGGRTYYFRVLANSATSYESSEEVKFPVPARVKHKAITAGVVGGILFFIVAIILSVCAVKICNKRKRRKQEKAYNMVAARLTDLRAADSTQVPFKKFRESGISGIVQCLRFTANWVWPPSRCGGEVHYWQAAAPSPPPSASSASPAPSLAPSSSDDGGFLPRLRAPLQPSAAPPLFRASSPTLALHWPPWPPWPPWAAAWTPWSPLHVSDLSSVPFPSSADGSFPTPPSPFRLRTLRLEAAARAGAARPRARPQMRHARPRTIAELPPPPHEASPESRSSSSGFGSKNASSSQHNRSSRTGSLAEWRPPPYRPPPPAPAPRPGSSAGEAVDAGSVDVHYEWDRATRTPTPSTPERPRPRPSRDDVEARVRAMKEEFLEFRKRQALRRRSPEPLGAPPPLSQQPPLSLLPSLSQQPPLSLLPPLSQLPPLPLSAAPAETVC
ncbi:protein turtle-like isoform X3 [Plodia interpunctella]|uniref:protein turtle-like isoform X3 n=1 Tax=Plodia interpunctella TaxID=58824 RepID=UPI0023680E44|nr:protein turtle-like isoform X3 [Plodia interpunctella]